MAFKVLLSLTLLVTSAMSLTSLQSGFQEDCTEKACNEEKNFICNSENVCECKLDPVTNTPWAYNEKLDTCAALEKENLVAKSGAVAPVAQAQTHSGSFGNSPACVTINTNCQHSRECERAYGNLAECKIIDFNPSLSRCQCCHRTQETGFWDNQCHFIRRIGQECEMDDQCKLGAVNSRCINRVCSFGFRDNDSGSQSWGAHFSGIAAVVMIGQIYAVL